MKTFLSPRFLARYQEVEPPFGPLGYIVFKRTYARWLGERTENWAETCSRVINGNFMLEYDARGPECFEQLCQEAEEAYHHMFYLHWLPAGRGLWASGIRTSEVNGAALTNCFYINVKPVDGDPTTPFCFMMDNSMLGAGVGFGVGQHHIAQLPPVAAHLPELRFTPQGQTVPDCREGWVAALKTLMQHIFGLQQSPVLDFDLSAIRPKGTPLVTFGGVAPGSGPLQEVLTDILAVARQFAGQPLTSVAVTDIMNLIGRCVVSGNIRRSAQIALGDWFDEPYRLMKNCDYTQADPSPEEQEKRRLNQHHRWASNNTLVINSDEDPVDWDAVAHSIVLNGEPGFLNLDRCRNYGRLIDGRQPGIDALVDGTNPCGEISLESGEPCNLVELFPSRVPDEDTLHTVARIAYRYAKRVTMAHYAWPETQAVVARNRRIGVSISGWQDWRLAHPGDLTPVLNSLYASLRQEDKRFSQRLGIPESVKITTVKPSGTLSLLAGVSPGIHWHYAPYYLRRVQMQTNSELAAYCQWLGFTVRPAVTTPDAVVVEFPIASPNADHPSFRATADVPLTEQLAFQHWVQTYWSDNQVSATLNFKQSEQEQVAGVLCQAAQELKSTAMLPLFELDANDALEKRYPDLPYVPIPKARYHELMAGLKGWPRAIPETEKEEELSLAECSSGQCPVR